MNTKKCCMCKEELPVTEFMSNKTHKDGLQGQCKGCQKEYRRQHYLKNRQKYIDKAKIRNIKCRYEWREYKSSLECVECGENHPACLHFHHINPDDKEFILSKQYSMTRKIKEMEKCEVLCANCHAKKHYQEALLV